MLRFSRFIASVLLLSAPFAIAQTTKDQEEFEYVRRTLATTPNYIPKAGIVPDAATASAIAYAVAIPVYGKKAMDAELPFRADLKADIWTVLGTMHCTSCVGGTVIVQIDKVSGSILRLSHSR